MPRALRHHALLADGRTAALVDDRGEVTWLCWPRADSAPVLLGLLDATRGGAFAVRPPGAAPLGAAYLDGGLVLRTRWRTEGAEVTVEDCLALGGGGPLLCRTVTATAPTTVEVRFEPRADWGRSPARLVPAAGGVVARCGNVGLELRGGAGWTLAGGLATCRLAVDPGRPLRLTLGDAGRPDDGDRAATTPGAWRRRTSGLAEVAVEPAAAAFGIEVGDARRALRLSAAVLLGLVSEAGGMVAAPTTSIPQWPGSSRCWDYRYAWPRDTALAALALLRANLVETASLLGEFCAGACLEAGGPVALVRVDGGPPPAESVLTHLDGFEACGVVRVGNAAAHQVQGDVAGEVNDLALALHRRDALGSRLARAVPLLAGWAAARGLQPDHGIWEIRGRPRAYTHSGVLAWVALDRAARLADAGAVSGDAAAWRAAATAVRRATLGRGVDAHGALSLHDGGGGPDAALAQVPLVGFTDPRDAVTQATLRELAGLDHDGLLDRHLGTPDGIADPCAPFVFPTLWLASALRRCGGDGGRHLRAALATSGDTGLLGEVADPRAAGPLGNYPQAQSHAALVLALTGRGPAPAGARARPHGGG